MLRHASLAVLVLLLGACASGPDYDRYGADAVLTPQGVAANPQPAAGRQVLWGGIILKTVNLEDRTQVEVLAYPLDSSEQPQIDGVAQGRFIFEQAGYLEPATYASQRQVTVVGTVAGTMPGRVGDANYNFPRVTASQHTLWPIQRDVDRPNIHFGIGVGSGGSWGGVGVGY